MFEIHEIKIKTEYNPLLISKQAPFPQAGFYGDWQEMMGRGVRRFEIKKDSEIIGFFQIIRYPLPFNQSLLYIPHAPLLRQDYEGQTEFLKTFRDKLIEIAKEINAIFARFDFYPALTANLSEYFHKVPPYAYNSVYFQSKYEWALDIGRTESELLNSMHPKNRYNIRLAENKGVAVEIIENNFEKYFEDFYSLMERTAKRNNFKLHPKVYYKNILENCEKNKNAFLSLAKYDGKILAINLVLLFGETAFFVFGGSSGEYKNLMFSHLAQWESIKEAKRRGFGIYNFGGIDGNCGKKLEGVSMFKRRFGGKLIEYSDSYDLIIRPIWYWLYNFKKRYWR
ncbi:MAG: peptidoglycan bridge formation glycyltransferase FemA/FemB family protein [Patescibacteria group bacterium]